MVHREEVIAYYGQMSEDAARREQKALWRVRRAKLDTKRTTFLLAQDKQWMEEMEKYEQDSVSVRLICYVKEFTMKLLTKNIHDSIRKKG